MKNRGKYGCQSAVAFLLILGLFGCDKLNTPKSIPTESETSQTIQMESHRTRLKRGISSELVFQSIDVINDEQVQLLRDLFEGLTAYDAKGNLVPSVAESWQAQDNKIWRFTLREQAKWSNGEAVTADDFVSTWQALSQSESPLKNYLAFMNMRNAGAVLAKLQTAESLGVIAEDARTLRIELDKPTPYLPSMLAHVSLLPQYLKSTETWVSNGAYQLQEFKPNHAVLIPNPYYWEKEKVTFKDVSYQTIRPHDSLEQLDIAQYALGAAPNIQAFPQLCGYFYEFNLADPMLQKSAVRKAIVSMVSIKNLVSGIDNALPSSAFLPKSLQGEQELPWEPVVVEQLLSQQGFSENHPLKLRIRYDDSPLHAEIATRLNRQLSQSDLLRVENEPMLWDGLQVARNQGDYQLIRSGWCADFNDPAAFLNLFYSKSPDNRNGYQNVEFDRLFENAMKTADEKIRREIYMKLAQIVQQEHLVLPIFQYSKPVYLAPSVMGAEINAVNAIYSKNLWRKVVGTHK